MDLCLSDSGKFLYFHLTFVAKSPAPSQIDNRPPAPSQIDNDTLAHIDMVEIVMSSLSFMALLVNILKSCPPQHLAGRDTISFGRPSGKTIQWKRLYFQLKNFSNENDGPKIQSGRKWSFLNTDSFRKKVQKYFAKSSSTGNVSSSGSVTLNAIGNSVEIS